MEEIIRLEDVSRFFPSGGELAWAVRQANLLIKRGDFMSVTGPSGSGKTTLLNLLGLIDQPNSGRIFFAESDLSSASEGLLSKIRLMGIGFIFQTFNLIPTLTALENILLPMELRGASVQERAVKAQELLRWVGLDGKEGRRPSQLSGGEGQRVAIARALANDPLLLLADEPTGNLDSKTAGGVMELLKRINRERGTAAIVVTHNLKVASFATLHYCMEDGALFEESKNPLDQPGTF